MAAYIAKVIDIYIVIRGNQLASLITQIRIMTKYLKKSVRIFSMLTYLKYLNYFYRFICVIIFPILNLTLKTSITILLKMTASFVFAIICEAHQNVSFRNYKINYMEQISLNDHMIPMACHRDHSSGKPVTLLPRYF